MVDLCKNGDHDWTHHPIGGRHKISIQEKEVHGALCSMHRSWVEGVHLPGRSRGGFTGKSLQHFWKTLWITWSKKIKVQPRRWSIGVAAWGLEEITWNGKRIWGPPTGSSRETSLLLPHNPKVINIFICKSEKQDGRICCCCKHYWPIPAYSQQTENQSYMALYQDSQALCVNGRSAILFATSEWNIRLMLKQ